MNSLKKILEKKYSLLSVITEVTFKTKNFLPLFFLMFLFIILTRAFLGMNALIISEVLDGNKHHFQNTLNSIIALVGIVYFFIIYKMIDSLCQPIMLYLTQKASILIEYQKIDEAIERLFQLPNKVWDDVNPKNISLRMNMKDQIKNFFYYLYRNLIPAIIEMFIALLVLFQLKVSFNIIAIIVVNSFLYLYVLINVVPKLNNEFLKYYNKSTKLSSMVLSLFENMRVVRVYGSYDLIINQFKKEMDNNTEAYINRAKALSFAEVIPSFIMIFSLTFIFYLLMKDVNLHKMSLGVFTASMTVATTIMMNLKHLVWAISGISENATTILPINILTEYKHKNIQKEKKEIIEEKENSKFLSVKNLNIKIENKIILNNICFEMKDKEKIWIIGHSGSGKTTLLNTLLGFRKYDGNIFFKGINIKDKHFFGFVPQSSDILTGSIKFNLLIGNEKATDEQMWDVLEKVEMKENIEKRGGLDIMIENEKYNFSGGEKQRIAIARALLSERDLMILDEPTSALDATTEKKLLTNLMKIDKAMIISIHRIKSIPPKSRVIKMESGQMIE
jgi:ABC-type multidrug transport system fused ATPase/permease subunit